MVHTPGNAVFAPESVEEHSEREKIMELIVGEPRASICSETSLASPAQNRNWGPAPCQCETKARSPTAMGRKGRVFLCLAQSASDERREGTNYKNGGSLAYTELWKVLPGKEKKSGWLWGSRRLARGVSMVWLEHIIRKKNFGSIFKETRFSPGCC